MSSSSSTSRKLQPNVDTTTTGAASSVHSLRRSVQEASDEATTTTTTAVTDKLPLNVHELRDNDVLCTGGISAVSRIGNILYRDVCLSRLAEFKIVDAPSKKMVCEKIIKKVQSSNQSRFMGKTDQGVYFELSQKRACNKVLQNMRSLLKQYEMENKLIHQSNSPLGIHHAAKEVGCNPAVGTHDTAVEEGMQQDHSSAQHRCTSAAAAPKSDEATAKMAPSSACSTTTQTSDSDPYYDIVLSPLRSCEEAEEIIVDSPTSEIHGETSRLVSCSSQNISAMMHQADADDGMVAVVTGHAAAHDDAFLAVTDLRDMDVLCAIGKGVSSRKGNKFYRDVCRSRLKEFELAAYKKRKIIRKEIVEHVIQHQARFIKERHEGRYGELSRVEAERKAGMYLNSLENRKGKYSGVEDEPETVSSGHATVPSGHGGHTLTSLDQDSAASRQIADLQKENENLKRELAASARELKECKIELAASDALLERRQVELATQRREFDFHKVELAASRAALASCQAKMDAWKRDFDAYKNSSDVMNTSSAAALVTKRDGNASSAAASEAACDGKVGWEFI